MNNYKSFPEHLNTPELKSQYCSLSYPDRPYYEQTLDTCTPICAPGSSYDPLTDACITLSQRANAYKQIIDNKVDVSVLGYADNMDYNLLLGNLILIGIVFILLFWKLNSLNKLESTKNKYLLSIFVSLHLLILYIFYSSCTFKKVLLITFLLSNIIHIYSIVFDKGLLDLFS